MPRCGFSAPPRVSVTIASPSSPAGAWLRRTVLDQPLLLGTILLLPVVFLLPPLPIDETRYLTVAWEMRRTGEFLVPHLNGLPYAHKPPLLFWLINAGWLLTGVHAWTARATTLLCSALSLVLLHRLTLRLTGSAPAARLAMWFLLGAIYFAGFANAIMFDGLLTACVLLAVHGLCDLADGRTRRLDEQVKPLANRGSTRLNAVSASLAPGDEIGLLVSGFSGQYLFNSSWPFSSVELQGEVQLPSLVPLQPRVAARRYHAPRERDEEPHRGQVVRQAVGHVRVRVAAVDAVGAEELHDARAHAADARRDARGVLEEGVVRARLHVAHDGVVVRHLTGSGRVPPLGSGAVGRGSVDCGLAVSCAVSPFRVTYS